MNALVRASAIMSHALFLTPRPSGKACGSRWAAEVITFPMFSSPSTSKALTPQTLLPTATLSSAMSTCAVYGLQGPGNGGTGSLKPHCPP
ncbi:hypothetical protein Nepgr_028628 [Nepenthes gracilis]|uniref:Uncharacterized protein n=1 Tax=Nepenthes gracilis TaxID=150966 RepID=A0AAD3TC16_NEPGR|nr:hypothetical protein Nepgr_028628 [Nepenthes gracilis]